MSFSITVPNATQSPGLFPAQANENFLRLRDIINNDHLFTDSSATNQGIHRQVTTINLSADPVSLLFGNGILYSKLDASSLSQLFWYNGSTVEPITPGRKLYANVLNGAAVMSGGSSLTIFADPGYEYVATGYVYYTSANAFSFQNVLRMGANTIQTISKNTGNIDFFTYQFSGNNLQVKNILPASLSISWSLTYNPVS